MRKERHLERADNFFNDSRYDRAEIEYLNVLRLDPGNAHACGRIGAIYVEQGRFGGALPYLLRARELAPGQLETRLKLARVFLSGGIFKEAFDEAVYVLTQRPDGDEAPVVLAESAMSSLAISKARECLIGLPPEVAARSPVLTARGILYVREGAIDDARALFEQALALTPDYAAAHAGLASCHEALGDIKEADAAHAHAARISPPTSPHRLKYAEFKLRNGDIAAAGGILAEIMQQVPQYLSAILRQVEVAALSDRLDDAVELLKKALVLDPTNPEALILSSRLARSKGEPRKALVVAEEFLRLYPNSPHGYVEAARAHLELNDADAASERLQRALHLLPEYPDAVVLLASIDLVHGDRTKVIAALRPVIEKKPRSVDAYTLLAEAYCAEGALDDALETYERLESVGLGNDRTAYLRGVVLQRLHRVDDARHAFETAFARKPSSIPTLEQLVYLDLAGKHFDAAMTRVQAALDAQPQHSDLHVLAAKMHFALCDSVAAEASLTKAIELKRDHASALGLLTGHYVATGDTARAIECLRTRVRYNPRDTSAWMFLGMLQEQRGERLEARDAYEKALEIHPGLHQAMNNLARLYSEYMGEPKKAYELASRARNLAPDDPYVADTLGWILYHRGEYSWASALFKESLEKLPDVAPIHHHLAMTRYMMNDEKSARRSFETALLLSSDFADVDESRRYLAILDVDPVAADSSAQALIEHHLSKHPDDPVASGRLAALLEQQGDLHGAIALLENAVKVNGGNIRALLELVRMHSASGDSPKALEIARRARQIAPDDNEVAHALGRAAFEAGDHPWAFHLLHEVAGRQPRNASVLYDLAAAAFSVGRMSECRSTLQRALSLSPLGPAATAARERLILIEAVEQTLDETAIEHARHILKENPSEVAALMVLAAAARKTNAVAEERGCLEQALSVYPHFAPAKRWLTLLLAAQAIDDERALEVGLEAREAFPDDPQLTVALGMVTYRNGDYKRAVALLETALLRGSSDATAWYYLGLAQAQLNRATDARNSLSKALRLGLAGESAHEARRRLVQVN